MTSFIRGPKNKDINIKEHCGFLKFCTAGVCVMVCVRVGVREREIELALFLYNSQLLAVCVCDIPVSS